MSTETNGTSAPDSARALIEAEIARLNARAKEIEEERTQLEQMLSDQRSAHVLVRLARLLSQSQSVSSDDVIVAEIVELLQARSRARRAEIVEHFLTTRRVPMSTSRVHEVLTSNRDRFRSNERGWWSLVKKPSQRAPRAEGATA